MRIVNMHEAKTHLSKLVDEAVEGDAFVIAKAGKPMVMVVSVNAAENPQPIGFMAGLYSVPDDFDHMGAEEIISMFESGE